MIRQITDMFYQSLHETEMMTLLGDITRFHRIQASEGYREGARYICDYLNHHGVTATIESYPADYGVHYLNSRLFPQWKCKQATLDLVYPHEERLADYKTEPLSLFQKSFSWQDDAPIDIVYLEQGFDRTCYGPSQLKGKLIFIREDFNAYYDWAIEECGAIGFLSDYIPEFPPIRTRETLFQARKYTTFWWTAPPKAKPLGFVLTPEQGDRLHEMCKQTGRLHLEDNSQPKYPRAKIHINSEHQAGAIENVIAEIKGRENQEVWLIAHLCHPAPGANDNGSGVTAAVSAMTVIQKLIDEGVIESPRYTIKLLLVPEFTGTYAHLSKKPSWKHVLSAINLDMVAGNQAQGYGPLTLSGGTSATSGLCYPLGQKIMTETARHTEGFSKLSKVQLFQWAEADFTAGSDHFILQDPTVGITCPMLGQWPDPHYHTDMDGLQNIDPSLLKVSAVIASSYVYLLSRTDDKSLEQVLDNTVSTFVKDVFRKKETVKSLSVNTIVDITEQSYTSALKDIFWMSGHPMEANRLYSKYTQIIRSMAMALRDPLDSEQEITADERIPKRTFRTPITNLKEYADGPEKRTLVKTFDEAFRIRMKDAMTQEPIIQYLINGNNSIRQIHQYACYDGGDIDYDVISAYIDLMVKLGLCTYEESCNRREYV